MRNWSGTYTYRAARRERPGTFAELVETVGAAPAVKVAGSGHSFNGIADSEGGVQLDLSSLITPPQVAADGSGVVVSGAMTYGDLIPCLRDAGLALPNLASLPHITVAGSVATGTHGSGRSQPGLADAVTAVELLTADGRTLWIEESDARFAAAVVSLGALGVVTRLRLRTVPAYDVRQDAFTGPTWPALIDRLAEILSAAYSVSVFGRWVGAGLDHIVLKSRVADSPQRPELPGAERTDRTLHPLQATGASAEAVTRQGGVPGPWCDRLPHFRLGFTPSAGAEIQSEFFVAWQDGPAAVEALLAVGERLEPVLLVAEIRAVAADGQWLSPSHGRDSVAFHFTWRPDVAAVEEAVTVVEQALAPYDARPHWGKVFVDPGRLTTAYPRLVDFEAVRRELDPNGKFRNGFLAAHVTS